MAFDTIRSSNSRLFSGNDIRILVTEISIEIRWKGLQIPNYISVRNKVPPISLVCNQGNYQFIFTGMEHYWKAIEMSAQHKKPGKTAKLERKARVKSKNSSPQSELVYSSTDLRKDEKLDTQLKKILEN